MGALTHPAFGRRRGPVRPASWWARAWVRALEESAYADRELREARALARGGRIGSVVTEPGRWFAAVSERGDTRTVQGSVPLLDDGARQVLVELVAAESGRLPALLAGELPHGLGEQAEEAGVELLPYGGELGSACGCAAWTDPCVHALALGYQVAWLVDADPLVLLQLRGLPREDLLAALHALSRRAADPDAPGDLETGVEAARLARHLLAEAEAEADASSEPAAREPD
jgi:uncharacterized Zn finger protein